MSENKSNSVDDLFKSIGAEKEIKYDGSCEGAGEQNQELSSDYSAQNHQVETDKVKCDQIQRTNIGHCFYCNKPGDCTEGYDFEAIYVCKDCVYQLDQEWEYRPGRDEEYEEDDY